MMGRHTLEVTFPFVYHDACLELDEETRLYHYVCSDCRWRPTPTPNKAAAMKRVNAHRTKNPDRIRLLLNHLLLNVARATR